jgi:peptidyl-prolyl cis-trans isomerase C
MRLQRRAERQQSRVGARTAIFLALLMTLSLRCTHEGPSRPYIARVGSVELKEEEGTGPADSLARARGKSMAFINEWVVSELLYQEAQRRGMADTDELRKQMEATRKRLAIEALLEKEVYGGSTDDVTDEDVAAAFKKNSPSFALREDVALVSYALFSEREEANQFRASILRGSSWETALAACQRDPLHGRELRAVARNQYFTQATLYPDELWKLVRTLPKDEVSYVVKTSAGYYVLAVHSVKHVGDMPDFDFVKNEVRQRLLIERRRARYEQLVSDLRARYKVDVNLSVVDTAGATGD